MSMHSMKRGSRARRKATQQPQAGERQRGQDRHSQDQRELTAAPAVSAEAAPSDSPASSLAFGRPTVSSPTVNSPSVGTRSFAAPAVSAQAALNGNAPAAASLRGAVQTGVRTPPPAPPEAPETPEEPREPLLTRVSAQLSQRASRMAQRAATAGRGAWRFLRTRTLEQWAWVAVVLLAGVLRVWGMGDKPLHHDESMHAYFSYAFARDPASYVYDPLLHGPFQFHAVGIVFDIVLFFEWIFRMGGPAGHPWINDATARIVPVFLGTAIIVLPAGLRRELGRLGALIAAFLLAISPAFVYFSRFLREDIYFNFFMFAMVVCAVRFARDRDTRWLVGLFAATVFAYATFEGTFLTLAIFIGFLAILAAWELGYGLARRLPADVLAWRERLFFSRTGLLLLLGAIASSLAIVGLTVIHSVGSYASAHQAQADAQVAQLEHTTVVVLLWVSIAVALFVIAVLFFQMFYDPAPEAAQPAPVEDDEDEDYYDTTQRPRVRPADRINTALERPGEWLRWRRARLDPQRQPLLWTLLSVQWVQWFVAFVTAWVLFAALFWVVPGGPGAQAQTWGDGFQLGVGKGIWQGLYYWAQQQDVARGGQPWYYYLLLIPLYEQLAVVFGIAGLIYSLFRPTRFRLFLVWWFLVSLGLYSWAGEKMPWLTIQILLPLMLLAAIALERVVETARLVLLSQDPAHWEQLPHALGRSFVAIFGTLAAVLLLLPMVHSMWVLAHQDAANGPQEMMVYVQTTTDVTTVVNKINAADAQLYHGQHRLKIAVGQQEEWPFYWYLRDYYLDPHPSVYASFDPADVTSPNATQQYDVLLLLPSDGEQFMSQHPTGYTMHQYKLRSWWDEAYKPPPCVPSATVVCSPSANWGSGVGVGVYLSYGSNPPPDAQLDLGRAADRVWRWLWLREPLGDTHGSFDFVMIVRDGVPIQQ